VCLSEKPPAPDAFLAFTGSSNLGRPALQFIHPPIHLVKFGAEARRSPGRMVPLEES
jgi:hypothetical protein